MTQYRRPKIPGATWFFTVNLADRHNGPRLTENIDLFRTVMRNVKAAHPFTINAIVVLPDHLHCIWTLPPGDSDYATRWSLIKGGYSRALPLNETRAESRRKRGERGIWQRRFWEHMIRDDLDCRRHADYIHWNPVKHGWARRVIDWEYSSFHSFVDKGIYPADWAACLDELADVGE